jgi:hypothetical protein
MLPRDFPPVSSVPRYFYAWRENGLWKMINHLLLMALRLAAGRKASPGAGVIDLLCSVEPQFANISVTGDLTLTKLLLFQLRFDGWPGTQLTSKLLDRGGFNTFFALARWRLVP